MSATVTPSQIVRAILLNANVVIMPGIPFVTIPYIQTPGDGSTVCYTSTMPDDDDQICYITNPMGRYFGREMRGRSVVHPGIKLTIRSLFEQEGYCAANAIAIALDTFSGSVTIVIEGVSHYVQSVYRTGPITFLGEQVGKKRLLWVINACLAMQAKEPSLG